MLSNIADREFMGIWIKVVKLLKLHLRSAYNLSQLSDGKIIRVSSAWHGFAHRHSVEILEYFGFFEKPAFAN